MPDDMDFCQQINQERVDDALAEHIRHRPIGESRETCIDCDEPIPEARRLAVPGCRRCVDCQTLLEHWRAL